MVQTRRSSFSVPSLPPANSGSSSKRTNSTNRRQSQHFERRKPAAQLDGEETVPLLLPPRAPSSKSKAASLVSTSKTSCAGESSFSTCRDAEKSSIKEESRQENKSIAVESSADPYPQKSSLPPKPTTTKSTTASATNGKNSSDETQQTMMTATGESSSHFLRDINLEKCSDLLSIPDPPSPDQVMPVTKSNRRRQSSPFLPPPLRDVTNQSGSTPTSSFDDSSTPSLANGKVAKKRSRKSLCHIPMSSESASNTPQQSKKQLDEQEGKKLDEESIQCQPEPEISQAVEDDVTDERETERLVLCEDDELEEDSKVYMRKTSKKRRSFFKPQEKKQKEEDKDCDHSFLSIRKTRKKRQSILLPSDVQISDTATMNRPSKRQSIMLPSTNNDLEPTEDDDESREYFQHLKVCSSSSRQETPSTTDSAPSNISALSNNSSRKLNKLKTDMSQIRQMVREYCALPNCKRNSSKYPEEIERICGYSLIAPNQQQQSCDKNESENMKDEAKSGLDWSSSPAKSKDNQSLPSILKTRREIILKLGPVVELIDSKKAIETKRLEDSTGCRVERSRSGKYRYFDILTNRKVNPTDYKKRYSAYVGGFQQEKRNKVKQWMENSKPSQTEAKKGSKQKITTSPQYASVLKDQVSNNEDKPACLEESMEVCDNDESMMNMEESIIMMDEPDLTEDRLDGNSPMETDLSPSNKCSAEPVVEMNSFDTTSVESAVETKTTVKNGNEAKVAASFNSPLRTNDTKERDAPCQTPSVSSPGGVPLLPLPSRDDESNDPEVAAAEQKLWSAIDTALATYSKEIIEIEAKRARAKRILVAAK